MSQVWSQLFSYETLVHALAGSVGSATAMSVFYPLDTIRSRLQVDDREAKSTGTMLCEIINEEGVFALYRGLHPVLVSLCTSGFVYFYTFHGLRAVFAKNSDTAGRDLLLGCLAGVMNVLITCPMWVVNTRIKLQGARVCGEEKSRRKTRYEGIIDGMYKILGEEGFSALWSGTVPSLVLVSNPAIQHMCYELLKRRRLAFNGGLPLSSIQIFVLGAISKCISTILTYPLQLVQSKLRYGSESVKGKTMIELLANIYLRHGIRGLYKGMESKLLQTVLTTALMYLCYEKIIRFVFHVLHNPAKSI